MTLDEIRPFYAWHISGIVKMRSQRLFEAVGTVHREDFMGPGPWTIIDAASGAPKASETPDDDPLYLYGDIAVAIDKARNLYNGNPGTVIAWIDALDIEAGNRVFHLGGGTGYYTAILARVAGEEGSVVMAEVDPQLAERAARSLADEKNVEVCACDGGEYDPGPCDAMLINAGVTHPRRLWLDRLKEGGRMVVPMTFDLPGTTLGKGALLKVTRHGDRFSASFLPQPVMIYSCTSVRDPDVSQALLTAFSTRYTAIGGVQSLRLDPHEPDDTCWMHTPSMCLSSLPADPPLAAANELDQV